MAIYSQPLATVLVAATRHDVSVAQPASPATGHIRDNRETPHLLLKRLASMRRRVRRLRVQCALERGAVAAQLHDADAQLAYAQLKLGTARARLVREPERALASKLLDVAIEETAVTVRLQHLEDELTRTKKQLRHVVPNDAVAMRVASGEIHAMLAALRVEMDALLTRHQNQLTALYDALTKKRLRLREYDTKLTKLRARVRGLSHDRIIGVAAPVRDREMTHDEQLEFARATMVTMRLDDDSDVDDDDVTMLEPARDDDDASYDADVDEYDDRGEDAAWDA